MFGGIDNAQMMLDARVKQMVRHAITLTSADSFFIGISEKCPIAIVSAYTVVETVLAGASAITLGTAATFGTLDVDAIATGTIADTSAEGTITAMTLGALLQNSAVPEANGYPIVPAGYPIYLTCDATPTTGICTLVVEYTCLDEDGS